MRNIQSTVYEFDCLVAGESTSTVAEGVHRIPAGVHSWLEDRCIGAASGERSTWLRLVHKEGRRAVQVTGFVGVMRSPDGHQIEVLPKVGKAIGGGIVEARWLLIEMLCCLPAFQHIRTDNARIAAARMPLLEVFISEFLQAVGRVVKRGLRGAYVSREENLHVLRGKLLMAGHLRRNLVRADRFYVQHDEFSVDRPANRVLRSALRTVIAITTSSESQRLGRELEFAFADVPLSAQPSLDLSNVRLDRGMQHYTESIAWARLILDEQAPITGGGYHDVPSLMFPMEKLFEAFVAKHLRRQLLKPHRLRLQAGSRWLVRHGGEDWFRLRPDLMVMNGRANVLVLDTKWKLIDCRKSNRSDKYELSQGDFYQLQAYGQRYLNGVGDVVLIYPKTDIFDRPLPVFDFAGSGGLRLWVLPFCLKNRTLDVPTESPCAQYLLSNTQQLTEATI